MGIVRLSQGARSAARAVKPRPGIALATLLVLAGASAAWAFSPSLPRPLSPAPGASSHCGQSADGLSPSFSVPLHRVRCETPPGGLPSLAPLEQPKQPGPVAETKQPAPSSGTPPAAPTTGGTTAGQTPATTPATTPTPSTPTTPTTTPPPAAPKDTATTTQPAPSTTPPAQVAFRYHPPGDLVPQDAGRGRKERKVWAPNMIFPVKIDGERHAFLNSQIWGFGGGGWGGKGAAGGAECDARNFDPMRQRDNYCEVRDHTMPLCPAGKGHQGQDIRPSTCKDNTWEVVAVVDGVITLVTSNTTVQLKGADGTEYRYLHMHPDSITVDVGDRVKQGQVIGKISKYMNGSRQTTYHLHFDIVQRVAIGNQTARVLFVPGYTSLINAYRKAKGLGSSVDADGNLIIDPRYEIGAVGPIPPTPAKEEPKQPAPAPQPTPAKEEPKQPAPAPQPTPAKEEPKQPAPGMPEQSKAPAPPAAPAQQGWWDWGKDKVSGWWSYWTKK